MIDMANGLVARDRELDVLGRLLQEVRAGACRLAVVTGEPGIGKSSLLRELVRCAEAGGYLTFAGRAAELERELPFGPFVDAFDEYLESLGAGATDGLDPDRVENLGRVFPAMGPPAGPQNAGERFRIYQAVRELIDRLAATRPVVLVLDDLHWADGGSLELFAYLLRRPPHRGVLVAAAYREPAVDPVLRATVEAAAAERRLERLELHALGLDAMAELLGAGDDAERRRIHERSGGNPFYAIQLSRSPPADGQRPAADDIPTAVAAAIAAEFEGLAPASRRLAEAASVVGDPFELDLATAAAADIDDAVALAAIDDLVAHDLIRPGRIPRRFAFRHPLVRAAVYAATPPGTRLALHARAADALTRRGAAAAIRAHHVECSARHGDEVAIATLAEAGRDDAQRAPRSAERWLAGALRLLPDAASGDRRAEMLVALSRAQAASGRFEISRASLLEAMAGLPDDAGLLRTELTVECAHVEQLMGRHGDARRRLLEAWDSRQAADAAPSVDLLVNLAVDAFYRTDYEQMLARGHEALAIARRAGDPPQVAAACAVSALACAFTGSVDAAERHRAEAAATVDAMSDDELRDQLGAVAHLGGAELYLDRYAEAAAHLERGIELARRSQRGHLFPVLVPALAAARFRRGQLAEAAALLDGAVEAARLARDDQGLAWTLLDRAFTACLAGDLDLATECADESVALTRALGDSLISVNAGAVLADATMERGDPARAAELLVASGGGDRLPRIPGALRAYYLELLTRAWLALDRVPQAQRAAAEAQAAAGMAQVPLAAALAGRASASVALALGDVEQAASDALASAGLADRIGAVLEAGRCRLVAGQALALAGQRDHAVAQLETAVTALENCGAARHRGRAERELGKLGHRPRRAPQRGGGLGSLSARELEVARLVRDRYTNAEIAAELFLSVKTVETHLRNIFRKVDAASRTDVARIIERATTYG
jgi:ATP/maltotriose-dependent transcriptional regulator MalT